MNSALAKPARARQRFLVHHVTPKQPKKCEAFASVAEMVQRLRPIESVHCLRPQVIENITRWFLAHFPGEVMYSVKSNPDPSVIGYLARAGVKHYDIASMSEIIQIHRDCPDAKMYFMHPVKSREAIYSAYYQYGIRAFSLDSLAELEKIQQVTDYAQDLELFVRISIPNEHAAYALSGKFGVHGPEAMELLRRTRAVAKKMGICFHVGSQCMQPSAYRAAMQMVRTLVDAAKVKVDVLDVGGGFPSVYPGMTPPPLGGYMDAIREGVEEFGFGKCKLFCEPGRALAAEGGSLVVKVELRKGNTLHINDGIYGSLFDAGYPGFVYPTQAIRADGVFSNKLVPFSFFGPTCDSLDAMKGPFMLPADIDEGDWIEIGQMGAYGATMRTKFNGFYSDTLVEVNDRPLMSIFDKE